MLCSVSAVASSVAVQSSQTERSESILFRLGTHIIQSDPSQKLSVPYCPSLDQEWCFCLSGKLSPAGLSYRICTGSKLETLVQILQMPLVSFAAVADAEEGPRGGLFTGWG